MVNFLRFLERLKMITGTNVSRSVNIFFLIRVEILHGYDKKLKYFLMSIYFILVLFAPNSTLGQTSRIDSLEIQLKLSSGSSRYEILVALFSATNRDNYELALQYATQAYGIAESIGDSVKIVESGRMMAYSLDDLGQYREVIKILNRVIKIASRNQNEFPELKSRLKSLYNNLAIAYMHRGTYDSSLLYHFKSLEIREQENDRKAIGTAKNNIGLVYFKLRNHEKAREYYEQSLEIKTELGDKVDLEKILINLGLCYNELNRSEEAIKSFNNAISRCSNNCSDELIKESSFGLGTAYLKLENFSEARKNFLNSLNISKSQGDLRYQVESLLGLAKLERLQNDFIASVSMLEEANKLVVNTGNVELLLSAYKESFTTYNLISNFEKAASFQTRYISLRDSIYSSTLIRNLATVQTNYEQRENLKTIQLINENIKLKDEQIEKQRLQYIFIVLVTVLIASLAGVLVWANRRQQKHNNALSEAKRIIERQNKELTKTNEELDNRVREKTIDLVDSNTMLQDVNEELDNYIYRTAHDIRGPLVTLKGVCNVAQMDVKDPLALDYLKRLDLTAEKLNSILTRLLMVSQINHAMLVTRPVNFDLIMQEVLRKFKQLPSRMKIEYSQVDNVVLNSDPDLVTIVLENLVSNAIKFYNTSDRINPFIKIEVGKYDADHVMMSVEDNGIGIEAKDRDQVFHLFVRASERSETGGIGLYLTKLSAHKLGGEIFLMHTTEKGSKFLVLFPSDLQPILAKRDEDERDRLKVKEMRDRAATETGGTDALERYYSSRRRSK
jgi:signal transduction histidine kinase/Tfp pilus assembly protein PilF